MSTLACVLLAAGAARRFGSAKQLALINARKAMLEISLETVLAVRDLYPILVLGAHADQIEQTLDLARRFPTLRICHNPDWGAGMGGSIACAVAQLDKYEAVLICLADQVAISGEHLERMMALWRQQPEKIIAAQYQATLGAPAIFPKRYFDTLAALEGDKGARSLILRERAHVQPFALPEAQWDIDTPEALNVWQARGNTH